MDNYEQVEKNWAMGCHLAALAMFLAIPFGNIIVPLVVWLIKRVEYPYVDQQGLESLNFQISMTIYAAILIMLAFVFGIIFAPLTAIFMFLAVALAAVDLAFIIIAAVKTNEGKDFRYPMTIRFIK